MLDLEFISVNRLPDRSIRHERMAGRSYLVAPVAMLVPGILNGSDGELYYSPEDIAVNYQAWNHMPMLLQHPLRNGRHVSARASGGVSDESWLGYVFKAQVDDARRASRLVAEGWFDEERTLAVDRRIIDNLKAGKPIELSTGLFTDKRKAEPGFRMHDGRLYAGMIAYNYRPDHLAILPDDVGACSISHGCGVLVNG